MDIPDDIQEDFDWSDIPLLPIGFPYEQSLEGDVVLFEGMHYYKVITGEVI